MQDNKNKVIIVNDKLFLSFTISILYDALNDASANTTNSWESSLGGTRKGAFVYGVSLYDTNTFKAMDEAT